MKCAAGLLFLTLSPAPAWCLQPAPELPRSFAALSAAVRAGLPPEAALLPLAQDEAPSYQDVENAFKGLTFKPNPADLVARQGHWELQLKAAPARVEFSEAGFVLQRRGAAPRKARLVFTQEIKQDGNAYTKGAVVFRAREEALLLTRWRGLSGDPPAAVLDLNDPSRFSTVLAPRWPARVDKDYECRAKDEDHLLCRVAVTERPLGPARVLYLGFSREKK